MCLGERWESMVTCIIEKDLFSIYHKEIVSSVYSEVGFFRHITYFPLCSFFCAFCYLYQENRSTMELSQE
jgi:hypothetical protein